MCHRNTAVSGWIGGTQPGPDLLLQSRTSVRRPQPVRAFVAGTGSTRTFCFGTWHHRHRHRHPQSPMLLLCYSPSCPVTAQSPTAHMHGSGTAAAHMQWDAQRTRVWCGGQARTATVADACMHGRSTGPWQLLLLRRCVLSFPFGGPSNLHPPDRSISLVRHPMIDKALLAVF